jgi:hypothetical protein
MYLLGHTDASLTIRVYQQGIDSSSKRLMGLEPMTFCMAVV